MKTKLTKLKEELRTCLVKVTRSNVERLLSCKELLVTVSWDVDPKADGRRQTGQLKEFNENLGSSKAGQGTEGRIKNSEHNAIQDKDSRNKELRTNKN